MLKRALWLGLILIATQLSTGCWCCWHRPYLFRPWCWQSAGCGPAASCCYGPDATVIDGGAPPMAPHGPTMPPATPLTRR